jgi:uroporphyrinogen-III decarboxylase
MRDHPMTARERLLCALSHGVPDRLPVTVHQWQAYHLNHYLGGMTEIDAFRHFGLDASVSVFEAYEPNFSSAQWRVDVRTSGGAEGRRIFDYTISTPDGVLTQRDEGNEQTTWTVEPLLKRPEDMLLVKRFLPVPGLDHDAVRKRRDELGDDGILRGFVFGPQVGPWQHACCLYGVEPMIYATFDDPAWVHELLRALLDRKLQFIEQHLCGADFDLIETGGGAASSTVISPALFRQFCLPYDRELHDALHDCGFRVVYHTCGGMMALLDLIPENGCDASETLTPPAVGGDADHAAIKRRLGDRLCLIGGLDQVNILAHGTPVEIRREVSRLFTTLGPDGAYILSPSDHFFDAPAENIHVYADAARECVYR